MFKTVKSLLFATNLQENCRPALETSISMAHHYRARLVLLHVIDREVPAHFEEHFKSVLGAEKWEALKHEHENEARQALIGKVSPDNIAKKVLKQYSIEAGIDDANYEFTSEEVVVADTNISDTIISQSLKHECDLIVLGADKGLLGRNSMGSIIKGVLRRSEKPVLVVPPPSEE